MIFFLSQWDVNRIDAYSIDHAWAYTVHAKGLVFLLLLLLVNWLIVVGIGGFLKYFPATARYIMLWSLNVKLFLGSTRNMHVIFTQVDSHQINTHGISLRVKPLELFLQWTTAFIYCIITTKYILVHFMFRMVFHFSLGILLFFHHSSIKMENAPPSAMQKVNPCMTLFEWRFFFGKFCIPFYQRWYEFRRYFLRRIFCDLQCKKKKKTFCFDSHSKTKTSKTW